MKIDGYDEEPSQERKLEILRECVDKLAGAFEPICQRLDQLEATAFGIFIAAAEQDLDQLIVLRERFELDGGHDLPLLGYLDRAIDVAKRRN